MNPRRIDLITTRNDHILRGIYKFEDDNMIICLQPGENKSIPGEFSVPDGSGLMLLRLKALDSHTASGLDPVSTIDSRPASSSKGKHSLEAVRDPGPGAGQLHRAHELLAGSWDILSITDDGELLGPDLVRAKFAQNSRCQGRNADRRRIAPKKGERRLSAIRIDPSKTPSEIDVKHQFDEVLKGIYRSNGDELMVCLAKSDGDDRPTVFEAPTGSNDFLFGMKMAGPDPTPQPETQPGDPLPRRWIRTGNRMSESSKSPVGTWTFNDSQGNLTLVFRSDSSFVATRTWRSGLKQLFEGDTTTSRGPMELQPWPSRRATVTSTMDPKLLSRNYHYWIQSVGDSTLVAKNLFGELRTAPPASLISAGVRA